MKTIRVTLFGALFMLLTACASLGLSQPQSFTDKVQYANGTLTAVVKTTTAALGAGGLSKKEAQSVQAVALPTRALLDTADEFGDVPAGQQHLALALSLLENLPPFLNTRSN